MSHGDLFHYYSTSNAFLSATSGVQTEYPYFSVIHVCNCLSCLHFIKVLHTNRIQFNMSLLLCMCCTRLDQQNRKLTLRVSTHLQHTGMIGMGMICMHLSFVCTMFLRVSVRAVYECGESEDSNTLLVAALSPKPGDPATDELTLEGSRKEILSLPRSSEPPEPTELPVLVEKTSALSKSESCSTLEAVSSEVSAVYEAHSVSLNLTSSSSLTGRDQMSTDEMGTSVDQPDQTSIHHQTSTNVGVSSYLVDSTDRNPHHTDTVYKETSADLNSRTLPLVAEDPSVHDHPLTSRLPSRQEVVHELSVRYPPTGPTTHTEHDRNYVSAPSALHQQPTTKTGQNRPEHSKHQQRQDPGNANDGSSVCGKELASPVGVEAKEVLTGDRLCGQTQAVATSLNDEGDLQTDTPPLAIDKPSPSLDTIGGRKVTHSDQLTSVITSPENKRKRMPCPVNPRSHRLAANFDANLSGGHPRNTTVEISSAPQPPKPLHQSHATKLPACHPTTLQSNPSPTVSPTRCPQPDKCGHSVGQTPIPASSERHSEKIIFSGEEQPITNCQKEGWGTSWQKEDSGMTHVGEGSQQPLRKSGNVGHLSWRQPITRQGLDKHSTSSELESHKADTGCLVGPPPANSDLVAPTP